MNAALPFFYALTAVLFSLPFFAWLHAGWSGWTKAAGRYRMQLRFPERKAHFPPAGFSIRVLAPVLAGANQEGLFLAASPLIGLFHAPLFIPWGEIVQIRKKGSGFEIILKRGVTPLRIPAGSIREVRSFIDDSLWES